MAGSRRLWWGRGVLVPQIQFLDSGWTVLFCVQRQYPQCKLCSFPSRFFRCRSWTRLTCPLLCNARCAVLGCQGRRHPCRGADAVSLGPVEPQRFSSCSSLTRCRCLCCAGPSDSIGRRQSRSHSCRSSYFLDKVVDMPVVHNDRCGLSERRKLRRSRSCSL